MNLMRIRFIALLTLSTVISALGAPPPARRLPDPAPAPESVVPQPETTQSQSAPVVTQAQPQTVPAAQGTASSTGKVVSSPFGQGTTPGDARAAAPAPSRVPGPKITQRDLDLINAAYRGETWNVRDLLAKGARIHSRDHLYGWTPLMWAASRGHLGAVRFLISKGARVNAGSITEPPNAVILAYGRSHTEELSATAQGASFLRMTYYIRPINKGITPLMVAAAGGYAMSVTELMKHGATVNASAASGETALIIAAFVGYLPSVQALLNKGAAVNVKQSAGINPLMAAVFEGNTPVVRLLLQRGADANVVTAGGSTMEELARYQGHTGLAGLLKRASQRSKASAVKGKSRGQASSGKTPRHSPGNDVILLN